MRIRRLECSLLLWLLTLADAFVVRHQTSARIDWTLSFSSEKSSTTAVVEARKDASPPQSSRTVPIRTIASLEKNPRLPVWPVANGVFLWLIGRFSPKLSAQLENIITGRVCPMPLDSSYASPFIMLVHHVHSFAPWDPIRWIQRKIILPEGFPSHPHRGFVTLTFILDGGFVHRDSLGQRQVYGSHQPHHSQWLYTGAGVLHEEMFLNDDSQQAWWLPQRQELFQLWINCPRAKKYDAPFSILLGDRDKIGDSDPLITPTVVQDKTSTLVLAGCYQDQRSGAPIDSELMVLHVKMAPHATWECDAVNMATAILYVRQGTLQSDGEVVETHHLAQFDNRPGKIVVRTADEAADFLFLAGEPFKEPVAQQGSFVLSSNGEINQAYADYQAGYFGRPWDHKLSDEEWKQHVQKYPCVYKPSSSVQ